MLTKTSEALLKSAYLLSAAIGGYRASGLTDKEKKALTDAYGLDENAWLGWRNAGRGMVGGILGSLPGVGIQTLGVARQNPGFVRAGVAATLGGRLLGAKLMTDKYSQSDARKIMAEKKGD